MFPIKNSQTAEHVNSQEKMIEEESELEDNGIFTFFVHIGEITGLKPVYPASEAVLQVEFNNDILYESEKLQMTEVIAIDQDIILSLDIEDYSMVNRFVTTPIIFSLIEFDTKVEVEKIAESGRIGYPLWKSEESIMDLEEALYGKRTKKEPSTIEAVVDKKNDKKSKSKTTSKSSQTSINKGKKASVMAMKDLSVPQPTGPQEGGTASIDLIRLFMGETQIVEDLILKAPAGQPLDDRIKSAANLPYLQITVNVDKPLPAANLFYYTLESIYNLPSVMSKTMHYEVVINMPSALGPRHVSYNTYTYAEGPPERFSFKKYYGTNAVSQFLLRDDYDNVKSKLSISIPDAIKEVVPRLEFNVVKCEYCTVDDINALKSFIIKYRCIGIEFYMSASQKKSAPMGTEPSTKGSKKSSIVSKEPLTAKKDEDCLHLMAFIDVCRLLYPGELRTRVACQLRTFDQEEFTKMCGVKESYFRPKVIPPVEVSQGNVRKQSSKKATKETDTVMSKDKSKKSITSLKDKLPPPPTIPEPSQPVNNENGDPTFVIMEFELRTPLVQAHRIDDLHDALEEILRKYSKPTDEPRVFKSKYISKDVFQNSLKVVAQNLKQQYLEYVSKEGKKDNVQEFVQYLTTTNQYQVHLNTITKSAATFCNVAVNYDPLWTEDEYHAFIGQSYSNMVDVLNKTLTELSLAGDETVIKKAPEQPDVDDELFYAKEAAELGAKSLASRYFLQRIAGNDRDVDKWLDYAIFKLQINEPEAAQECVMEALNYNKMDPDCLLFFSCLLARKGQVREAETCLLNITLNNPKWIQAWMALYCVYQRGRNYEGMELCLEISEKYKNVPTFNRFYDLAWNSKDLPDKHTFRAITYFINVRLFEEAEVIISNEVVRKETDITEILLSVINMYRGHFEHAYNHIERAFQLGSCSHHKFALRGHIQSLLEKPDCAILDYEFILKNTEEISFDLTVYLIYLKAGLAYSSVGDHEMARKVLLQASEKRGTPYSWLTVGVLYYYENDFQSAEECLVISNSLDNLMPETWAYLTLVNIKLGRPNEATSCYRQALDRRLQNPDLLGLIDFELKKWEEGFLKTT